MSFENATMIQCGLGLGEVVQLAAGWGVMVPAGVPGRETWVVIGLYGIREYDVTRSHIHGELKFRLS